MVPYLLCPPFRVKPPVDIEIIALIPRDMSPGVATVGEWRRSLLFHVRSIALQLGLGEEPAEKAVRIAVSLGECRGRGCRPESLAAAIVWYAARWSGLSVRPSEVYSSIWQRVPRQSFWNSVNKLLELLGHSPRWKRVLLGRESGSACRNGVLVAREGSGAECETWPGASPAARYRWGGGMSVRVSADFNVYAVIYRLRKTFGTRWFSAGEAAGVLLVSTRTASTLLRRIEEEYGLIESRQVPGKNMRQYRVVA